MQHLQTPFYLIPVFCITLFVAMGSAPLAIAESCEAEFKSELEKLSIPEESLKDSYTIDIYETSGGRISRVEGWASFNDCKGNLVVIFDRSCLFDRIYTTTDCMVPGVKEF